MKSVLLLAFVFSTTYVADAGTSTFYQSYYQYVEKLKPVWNSFKDNFQPYRINLDEDCGYFPGISVIRDCDVSYIAGQMHRWMNDVNKVTSEIFTEIKLLLQASLTLFDEKSNKSGKSTTSASMQPTTTTTSIPTTTVMSEQHCETPVLYVAYANEEDDPPAFGIALVNSFDDETLQKNITTRSKITGLVVDRVGKNIYASLDGKDLAIYSRKTCLDDFTFNGTSPTTVESNSYILDSTERYILKIEGDPLSGRVAAYQIKEDGTLVETSKVEPSDGDCTMVDIYLYPRIENVIAVTIQNRSPYGIIFFKFDSTSGTLTELNKLAETPSDIGSLGKIAFSNDGKHIYAADDSDKFCVFKIELNAAGDEIDTVTLEKGPLLSVEAADDTVCENLPVIRINPKNNNMYISNDVASAINTFDTSNDQYNFLKTFDRLTGSTIDFVVDKGGEKIYSLSKPRIFIYEFDSTGAKTGESYYSLENGLAMWYQQ